ncbi:dihydropteroate synthase [Prochlorococcus sp. MIT 0603]
MAVINITPDSFSDGGRFLDPKTALNKATDVIDSGADILDIGGQSTRPGAQLISCEEELNRITPVITLLRKEHPNQLLSIDTFYSKVAKKALDLGVNWVNDISGGRFDSDILNVVADSGAPFVINHSRGNSSNMNTFANYQNVTTEVYEELQRAIDHAYSAGVSKKQIIIDPGIGFAKNNFHNIDLLYNLEKFTNSRFPVLVGPSRKKFIGHTLNQPDPMKRIFGTAAVVCRCVQAKVDMVRVHDVSEMKQVIDMSNALWN